MPVKILKQKTGILLNTNKTSEIYHIDYNLYHSLIRKEFLNNHKITPRDNLLNLNLQTKKMLEKLNLEERTEPYFPNNS